MSMSKPQPPAYAYHSTHEREELLASSSAAYSSITITPSSKSSHPADNPRTQIHQSNRCRSPGRHAVEEPNVYRSTFGVILFYITLFLVLFNFGAYVERTSDSTISQREASRKLWEQERINHTLETEKWFKDRDARHSREVKEIMQFEKQKQDLIMKKERMVEDYRLEEQRWREKMESYMAQEHDWHQKILRFAEHWQHMLDEENKKRQEAQLYWGDIQGDEHCLANGVRKYSAQLVNLTPLLNGMEACKVTPITFNGVKYSNPLHCENTGANGIRGHWIVDDEGVCAAYWEFVKIKDCTAPRSGYRRIEAKLGVVHAGENPENLCLSTPLNINGQIYGRPLACPDWGTHGFWGVWNVPDDGCK